jgi:hypothetical protein
MAKYLSADMLKDPSRFEECVNIWTEFVGQEYPTDFFGLAKYWQEVDHFLIEYVKTECRLQARHWLVIHIEGLRE